METFKELLGIFDALFGKNAGLFLTIPLFIALFALTYYPFTGTTGIARGWAFVIMAGIPAGLYMNFSIRYFESVIDLTEKEWMNSFWGVGLPLTWCALIWIFCLVNKITDDHKESQLLAELLADETLKNEAAKIVNGLNKKHGKGNK